MQFLHDFAQREGVVLGWCKPEVDSDAAAFLAERQELGLAAPFVRWSPTERTQPGLLLDGVRTVISLAYPYEISHNNPDTEARGTIARFSRGRDYHLVVRQKLERLAEICQARFNTANIACNIDTGPLIDRYWAAKTGLGGYGKNTAIITEEYGSWVTLGELLLDVGLSEVQQHDPFMAGTCQGCNRCISACPTGAIEAPYRVNPYKCLSFLTQQKGIFPRHYRDKLGNRVYGCDRCQEVCPYNVELLREGIKKKPRISDDDVEKVYPRLDFLLGLTNKKFKYFFAGTALGWRGKAVIQRNALIAFGNLGYLTEAVFQAAECENPNLRTHAYWAISKAGGSKNIDYLIKRLKLETDPEALGELHYCLSRYV